MFLFLVLLLVQQPQQLAAPLPDPSYFLRGIRANLRSDRLLLSQYAYNLTETQRDLDKNGKIKKATVLAYEVYPSLDEGLTYRRLISKDGAPVSGKELAKQDSEYDKKFKEHELKLQREGSDEKSHRLAKEAEERRKEDQVIDELFQLYDIAMTGREELEGRSAIRLAFRPRAGYKPRSRDAGILMKVAGSAWFGEQDFQLIRLEVELIDNLSIGLGVLARLNKGGSISFQRQLVNDEIWLPSRAHFSITGRVLLFKGVRVESISEFSEYRKFTVTSSATSPAPKK